MVYATLQNMENYQVWFSLFVSFAASSLSVGHFIGGCHRIQTKKVWNREDVSGGNTRGYPWLLDTPPMELSFKSAVFVVALLLFLGLVVIVNNLKKS